jgi:hypothetical protein
MKDALSSGWGIRTSVQFAVMSCQLMTLSMKVVVVHAWQAEGHD